MPDFAIQFDDPALTVALALAAGMIAQSLARHLRMPGIVVLLVSGVLLGPDGIGIIRPDSLGHDLHVIVDFAVAIVLFEGGLNLRWNRMRHTGSPLPGVLSVGALVTAAGGSLLTVLILDWDVRTAILFGTLVVVTGPTVVTPLLRRIRIKHRLETLLESEGVLIDGIGAIAAIVAFEVLIGGERWTEGLVAPPLRLGAGILTGAIGGAILVFLLRLPRLVPEGFENAFALAIVLACFQVSNAVVSESGIVCAIVAGLVVGNVGAPSLRDLQEFKEQLTVLVIGLLFILLAAAVRVADVIALGWGGLLVVLGLMFIVRPAAIWLCCWRSGFSWKEKAFLAWLAPRGIIAAAVSTFFAERLHTLGIAGGDELRALVFMVIAATVVVQGGTAEPLARWLGLRRPRNQGYAILGAHALARTLARRLIAAGEPAVLMDANAARHRESEAEGLDVVFGNALEERALRAAEIESRRAALGLLTSSATNLLFAAKARREFKVESAAVAVQSGYAMVEPQAVREAGATILFGQDFDLEQWMVRLRHGKADVATWRWSREEREEKAEKADADIAAEVDAEVGAEAGAEDTTKGGEADAVEVTAEVGGESAKDATGDAASSVAQAGEVRDGLGEAASTVVSAAASAADSIAPDASKLATKSDEDRRITSTRLPKELRGSLLPLLHRRGDKVRPFDDATRLRDGDAMEWLVATAQRESAEAWLRAHGWSPALPDEETREAGTFAQSDPQTDPQTSNQTDNQSGTATKVAKDAERDAESNAARDAETNAKKGVETRARKGAEKGADRSDRA